MTFAGDAGARGRAIAIARAGARRVGARRGHRSRGGDDATPRVAPRRSRSTDRAMARSTRATRDAGARRRG
eukprot:13343-Pelagococcus_subviridis.AAC.1